MSGIQNLLLGGSPVAAAAEDPDFEYVTLLLPGNGTNGAQNNTFLDSSTNNFTITRNGNTTQGTFSPFSQTGWSNYFDGSGDYLTVADNAALEFGSGNFTIEAWVFLTTSTQSSICAKGRLGASNGEYVFRQNNSNISFLYSTNGTSWNTLTSTGIYALNQWNHVAFVRSGNTYYFWINGVESGTGTLSATLYSGSGDLGIGANNAAGDALTGYISNLRIVKGTAVYTSAFTPSTTPLTAISGTSLLTCQSNRFIDNSTNAFTITVNGNTSVQAFSPFAPTAAYSAATNGGSGYFDGTGDYLYAGSNSAFQYGTGDFTYECWVYHTSLSGQQTYFARTTGNQAGVYFYKDTSNYVGVYYTSQKATSNITITANQWYYLVATRLSGTLKIFINGVETASVSDTTNLTEQVLYVGGDSNGTNPVIGYMSNARVLKGTGYSTITVPTAPLTAITNTSLLLNFTNAGITDATAKNDLETVGNAQISTTQSKFGGSSMYFDGTGDWLVSNVAIIDLYGFGTGDFTIELWMYSSSFSSTAEIIDFRPSGDDGSTTAYPTIYTNTSSQLIFFVKAADRITSSALSTNTWYHIAICRYGTSTKMFINGTQSGSTYTDSNDYKCGASRPAIGINGYNTSLYPFTGYMQDLRITKGVARYTANFTAPTAAFPLF